jgi:hypothetical protein
MSLDLTKLVKEARELPHKLNFFGQQTSEDVVESGYTEEHHPVGFTKSDHTEPIRFFVRGSEHWIDLEKSYIEINGRVLGTTGQASNDVDAFTATDGVTLTNNFLHNLFSSVHVSINDCAVTFSNDHYPYLAYIQNLMNYTRDFSASNGSVYLWAKDTAGQMNKPDAENLGAIERKKWIRTGNKVSGILKLRSPLFLMEQYICSFLNLDITLKRTTNPDFCFITSLAKSTFQFQIDSITFHIRKVKLLTSVAASIEKIMHDLGTNIEYPLRDARVMTKTYAGYGTVLIEDNLFHGLIPNRIVVGIVDNDAFSGAKAKNPFDFAHKGITEIGLTVNGVSSPYNTVTMDFTDKNYAKIYHLMLESMQGVSDITNVNAVDVTQAEFGGGYTLFNFDMSPDQYGNMNQQLFNQPANVQLKIKFAQGKTAETITLVVYYELFSRLVVDDTRRVQLFEKQ